MSHLFRLNFAIHENLYFSHSDRRFIDAATSKELYHLSATTEVIESRAPRRLQSSRSLLTKSLTRNSIVNVLKDHIKKVLNIDLTDQEADRYIVNTFRLDNPNPMYIFDLSNDQNDTVYFHRTDFTEAVFPNVSTLQKLRKIMIDSKLMPENDKDRRESRLIDEKFLFNFEKFKNSSISSDESDDMKVVEENVRTEKNFFKFMDDLNSLKINSNSNETASNEGKSLPFYEHQHVYPLGQGNNWQLSDSQWNIRTTRRPIPKKIAWSDLGLHGWRGEILPPKNADNDHP